MVWYHYYTHFSRSQHTTHTTITMTAPTATQQHQLAPLSAQTSLKRSRVLFDTTTSSSSAPSNKATTTSQTPLFAATEAFVPPLFDSLLHQQTIQRKIRLQYPGEYSKLAFQAVDDENNDFGAADDAEGGEKRHRKETATARAVREIRKEAMDRLRSGEDYDVVDDVGAEGRLVIHREVDMKKSSSLVNHHHQGGFGGGALVVTGGNNNAAASAAPNSTEQPKVGQPIRSGGILVRRDDDYSNNISTSIPTPKWHAPWKLSTVLSSHLGWVRSIAFDPHNTLFATGGNDRVIKIFDLAKACVASQDALKITLTGHISPVRGLAFSERHPYLFSAGEDKLVKCWDLETNQVIRHYHGHLSGVFALKLHPTLDLLVTGGR